MLVGFAASPGRRIGWSHPPVAVTFPQSRTGRNTSPGSLQVDVELMPTDSSKIHRQTFHEIALLPGGLAWKPAKTESSESSSANKFRTHCSPTACRSSKSLSDDKLVDELPVLLPISVSPSSMSLPSLIVPSSAIFKYSKSPKYIAQTFSTNSYKTRG